MTRLSDFNIRKIVLILAILSGPVVSLFSQDVKEISGVVNVYRKVTAINSLNSVTVDNINLIGAGDTILIIQMQGMAVSYSDPPSYFGQIIEGLLGSPGGYELLLVSSINTLTKRVNFTRNLQKTYDIRGNVQLIKVPSYDKVMVKGELTSDEWNPLTGTGGVLAIIVGSKLELDKVNGEIDVSGKGFVGGKDEVGIGECVVANYDENSKYSFPTTWLNAGFKGEGVANQIKDGTDSYPLLPLHTKGQGPAFTGGGGGNGKYSGGGGGANRGFGADGKVEINIGPGSCTPFSGGLGGSTDPNPIYTDGIYFGGGGGASTHASGESSSDGGKGGGIVIILADTISGNGRSITADGISAPNVSGNGGGGGGGAGGSILLSLRSFTEISSNSLKISAKGGNGGFRAASWGSGGGGGGGLISVSMPGLPVKVVADTAYGTPAPASFPQGYGELTFNLIPEINGFLFNSIRSDSSGTQVDTICSDVSFGKIIGTNPIGGISPYTVRWEKSTISASGPWQTINGVSSIDYSPGRLTTTTWFRRVITDSSSPVIIDESIPVEIVVQQAIDGNKIGKDTTICYNQNPLPLIQRESETLANGNGKYNFKWIQSVNLIDWSPAVGTGVNSIDFDPSSLQNTTNYMRFVKSGYCEDTSNRVRITVLPPITNNLLNNIDEAICEPSQFKNLVGSTPSGGSQTFSYIWQEKKNSSDWTPVNGINGETNNNPYNPSEYPDSAKSVTRHFRRIIMSGPNNTCKDTTLSVKLDYHPEITKNIIQTDSGERFPFQYCQDGSTPLKLYGSVPEGGSGTYTYQWLAGSSYDALSPIPGKTLQDFEGDSPEDFLTYSRLVTDGSGLCSNATGPSNVVPQRVFVYRKPVANAGIAADICGGTVTLHATMDLDNNSTDGTGWEFSMNKPLIISYSDSTEAIATVKVDTISFDDEWGREVTFSWKEVNGRGPEGECFDRATVKINFFTRVKELGPDRDKTFYSFSNIIHLDADPYLSWETGLWTTIAGSDNIYVYDPSNPNNKEDGHSKPDAIINPLNEGLNSYRWTVSNKNNAGTAICYDEYLYDITVIDIYIPNAFSPNGDGLYDKFVVKGLDPDHQEAELRIVNSAGTEVFYTTNREGKVWTDWDGRNTKGSDLPEGTYYYLLRLMDNDNNSEVYKKQGFVVLKRFGQVD